MEQHYPKQWKNRMTTGESIAAELRFQIVNSTLEPDTLLTENQVAKQFDVSRLQLEMHLNCCKRINSFTSNVWVQEFLNLVNKKRKNYMI